MATKKDPRITKRKVIMRNARYDAEGNVMPDEAVDYVRPDFLDAYVADAQKRWGFVRVVDEPDAGPGGYHGATYVPEGLDHEFAGRTFDATTPAKGDPDATALWTPDSELELGDWDVERLLAFHREAFGDSEMWLTAAIKDYVNKTGAYATACAYASLFNAAATGTAGTEPTGGSPAYARKATAWGTSTSGVMSTGPHTFDVPTGFTVAGFGLHSAVTAGTYYDGGSLTSQAFASQGTYALTITETTS